MRTIEEKDDVACNIMKHFTVCDIVTKGKKLLKAVNKFLQ